MDVKSVELDAAEQKALKQLAAEMEGLQQFIQATTQAGQNRFALFNARRREIYEGLAKKYGLDLDRVSYAPSVDGTKLVPTVLRLADPNDVQS
jgi:hypothetical protein